VVSDGEHAVAQRPQDEAEERPTSVLLETVSLCECQGTLDLYDPFSLPGQKVDDADVGKGVNKRLTVIQAFRKLKRTSSPHLCPLSVFHVHAKVRQVGVCDREFVAGLQTLEQTDSLNGRRLSIAGPTDEPQEP
jgi:hypothetical protein